MYYRAITKIMVFIYNYVVERKYLDLTFTCPLPPNAMEIVQKYRRETGQRGSKVLNLSI
jgi:hypothetical protein